MQSRRNVETDKRCGGNKEYCINQSNKDEKRCENERRSGDGKECGAHHERGGCSCGASREKNGHRDHEHCHHHGHDHHHDRNHHCCGDTGCSCGHEHSGAVGARTWLLYGAGALLLLLAFLGEFSLITLWLGIPSAVLVYAFFGKDPWLGMIRNVRSGRIFTENTLMCVATVGAIALLEYADAAAVMYLYSLGEMIQGLAERKSRRNIEELIDVTDEYINKVENRSVSRIAAAEAKVGDVIRVTVGERIALDGIVIKGSGYADTSSVTGEGTPLELLEGVACLSGSVLIGGSVLIRVTEAYENSTASKLRRAMERALAQKSPTEKRISRFASIFVPLAFALSALLLAVVWFITGDGVRALRTALVILVVSCPCSLVLSIPLTYFSGMGRAATRGIVFRGGQVIDAMFSLKTVVFDKTGTLTESELTFDGIWLPEGAPYDRNQLLDISRCALEHSPHAAARSFCQEYKAKRPYHIGDVENIGGRGLVCTVEGISAAFGNRGLMQSVGVSVKNLERTAIFVAIGGKLCGALLFSSKLKPETLSEVARLRRNGVERIAIMSGDNKVAVVKTAEALGIAECYAELKPDEKLETLEAIIKEERKKNKRGAVGFCGDGLNDAAAIARADIGIAMGSGLAVTVDNADAVIVDDSIARVNDMIAIACGTVGVANQNIAISVGIKALVVLASVLGFQSLELAIVADVGAAVLTVLNALRAGKIK